MLVNRDAGGGFDAVPIVLITGWRNPLEISVGSEYSYKGTYFARAGYFEDFSQFFSFRRISIGAGLKIGELAVLDAAADIPLGEGYSRVISITLRMPIGAGL